MPRLWVEKNWFVEVDEEGFYQGTLGEGAFGSVLCLQGSSNYPGKPRLAWKLPRLLADTLEENAYIEGLLRQESKLVQWISSVDPTGAATRALVHCEDHEPGGNFRGRRTFRGSPDEVASQDEHVFFIQFEKAKRPRLCLVNISEEGLSVFPPGAKPAMELLLTGEAWTGLQGSSKAEFLKASFLARPQYQPVGSADGSTVIVGPLQEAGADQRPFHAWFSGVSSILWEWANMNLQEAISRGLLENWQIKDHILLWKQILDGVACLHENKLLHADLRPANIFCIGRAGEASNYKLGDYGSLSSGEGLVAAEGLHGGNTLIGPDVGRGRSSPFYSIERRSGVERESADTAVVVYGVHNKEYRIWLGWKSQVLDFQGNLKEGVAKEMLGLVPVAPSPSLLPSLDSLRPDDRIRLRDQVFKVKQVLESSQMVGGLIEGGMLCVCHGTYATVVHDKLTVYNLYEPDAEVSLEPQIIPLSSYTELRQWSAATDLFSLGALFLYTIYSIGRQKGYHPRHVERDQNDDLSAQDLSKEGGSEALVMIDAEFRQSMAVLESVPYLRVLWPDLDGLWKQIVKARKDALQRTTVEDRQRIYEDLFCRLREREQLLTVVSNITASVPNSKVLLQYFKCNSVSFVLFLHFILRCLHRREHLGHSQTASDTLPFCADRTEKPTADGAARKARQVLDELTDLLGDQYILNQTVDIKNDVPDYDVRSEYLVKKQNHKLNEEKQTLRQVLANIKSQRKLCKAGGLDLGSQREELFKLIDAAVQASPSAEST
jgi:serine/threonine protein kinase